MGLDAVGIGISGLLSFQKSMATASHNITNADTEGYSRQRVSLSVNDAMFTGDGYVGTGTGISKISRIWSSFAQKNLESVTSSSSEYKKMEDLTGKLDNIFSNEKSGLSPKIQDFFTSIQAVSESPSSSQAKTQFLDASQAMASRFNSLGDLIEGLESEVQGSIKNIVKEVNSYISAISSLNEKIVNASQMEGRPPNDLYDQRDNLVLKLSEKIDIKTLDGSKGNISIFIGNGQPIITERGFNSLTLVPNEYNNSILDVGISVSNKDVGLNISNMIKSGELGAVLGFRKNIESTSGEIGRLAAWVASEVNAQHNVSITGDGKFGSDIFAIDPSLGNGSSANLGTAVIEVGFSKDLNDELLADSYRLEKTATSWSIMNLRTKDAYTHPVGAPMPMNFEGMNINNVSGTAITGDSFILNPTSDAMAGITAILTSPKSVSTAYPIRTSAKEDYGVSVSSGELNYDFIKNSLPTIPASLRTDYTIILDKPTNTFNIEETANPGVIVGTSGYNPSVSEQEISFGAWSFTISGSIDAGSEFYVNTQEGGAPSGDNRAFMDMAKKQFENLFLDGTETIHGSYENVVANTGSLAHNSIINAQAQNTLLVQAQERREEISGVNLDEEAANLIKLQQAYQAAAKVIQVADKMFQVLMNTV